MCIRDRHNTIIGKRSLFYRVLDKRWMASIIIVNAQYFNDVISNYIYEWNPSVFDSEFSYLSWVTELVHALIFDTTFLDKNNICVVTFVCINYGCINIWYHGCGLKLYFLLYCLFLENVIVISINNCFKYRLYERRVGTRMNSS